MKTKIKDLEKQTLGNCYESAGKYVMERPDDDLILVHGRPTLTVAPNNKYEHAWVEYRGDFCGGEIDMVFDAETGKSIPKAMYLVFGRIDHRECNRYSIDEARDLLCENGHWGPWEK